MNFRELDKTQLPKHVAIIMDGNGRWARLRGRSRLEGHRRGKASVKAVLEASRRLGISYVSLYAFSAENWYRPKAEVEALMALLEHYLIAERENMKRHGIRLMVIGDRNRLPSSVRTTLERALSATKDNARLTVILALSYSGRKDIVQMVQQIAAKVKQGECDVADIDEGLISAHVETAAIPDPDLLIRTSGELRISNFFLWQIPYAELYFTPVLWPDFREKEYLDALAEFQRRQRRFGLTQEQITPNVISADRTR